MKRHYTIPFILGLTASQASAALVVGNQTLGTSGASTLFVTDQRLANSFIMPAVVPDNVAVLESISLGVSSSGGDQTITISLWSDSAGEPGAPINVLTFNSITISAPTNAVFVPNTNFVFTPSTTYWVVLNKTTAAPGSLLWSSTSPGEDPGSIAGASISFDTLSSNSGATWSEADGPYVFAVNGTSVPEPSNALMLLLGIGGVILARRR